MAGTAAATAVTEAVTATPSAQHSHDSKTIQRPGARLPPALAPWDLDRCAGSASAGTVGWAGRADDEDVCAAVPLDRQGVPP